MAFPVASAAVAAGQGARTAAAAAAGQGGAVAVAAAPQVSLATRKTAAIQAVFATQLFPIELIHLMVQYATEEQFKGRKITLSNHATFGAIASVNGGRQVACYYEATMPFFHGVGPIQLAGCLPILGAAQSEQLALVDLETAMISSWQTQRRQGFRPPHALVSTQDRFWFTEGCALHSCTHRDMVPSQPRAIPAMPLAEVDRVVTMVYDPTFSRLLFSTTMGALVTFDLNTTTFTTIPTRKNLKSIHFIATVSTGVIVVSPQSITLFAPDFSSVLGDESLVDAEDDEIDNDELETTFGVASYDPSIDRLYVAGQFKGGGTVGEYRGSTLGYVGLHTVRAPVIALASFQGGWVYVTQNRTNTLQTMRYQHEAHGVVCQRRLTGNDRLQVDLFSPLLNNNLVLGPRFISVLATKAFENLHLYEVVPGDL